MRPNSRKANAPEARRDLHFFGDSALLNSETYEFGVRNTYTQS